MKSRRDSALFGLLMPDDKYLSVSVQKQAAIYAFRSSFSKKKKKRVDSEKII